MQVSLLLTVLLAWADLCFGQSSDDEPSVTSDVLAKRANFLVRRPQVSTLVKRPAWHVGIDLSFVAVPKQLVSETLEETQSQFLMAPFPSLVYEQSTRQGESSLAVAYVNVSPIKEVDVGYGYFRAGHNFKLGRKGANLGLQAGHSILSANKQFEQSAGPAKEVTIRLQGTSAQAALGYQSKKGGANAYMGGGIVEYSGAYRSQLDGTDIRTSGIDPYVLLGGGVCSRRYRACSNLEVHYDQQLGVNASLTVSFRFNSLRR